jgi:hypothetical protein
MFMARARRVMPFLQRQKSTWYLRYRVPVGLRALTGRTEVIVSLGTHIARNWREPNFQHSLPFFLVQRLQVLICAGVYKNSFSATQGKS